MKWSRLEEREKEVHKAYLDSGMFDLSIGVYFITVSIVSTMPQLVKMAVIFLLIMAYQLLVRKIIEPRLAPYSHSSYSPALFRLQSLVIIFMILFVLMMIMVTRMGLFTIEQQVMSVILGIAITVISGIFSWLLNFYRLLVYGVIMGILVMLMLPLTRIMGETAGIAFLLIRPGILITSYGAYRLKEFISRNPLDQEQSDKGSRE